MKPIVRGAVIVNTSKGPLCIYLYGVDCPIAVRNFLGLCEFGYYIGAELDLIERDNLIRFRNTWFPEQQDYCFDGLLNSDARLRVTDEKVIQTLGPQVVLPDEAEGRQPRDKVPSKAIATPLRLNRKGLVFYDNDGAPNTNSSRFCVTTTDRDLSYLSGKVTVFGEVVNKDGLDLLSRLNEVALKSMPTASSTGRPLRVVRIRQTIVMENPFPSMSTGPMHSSEGEGRWPITSFYTSLLQKSPLTFTSRPLPIHFSAGHCTYNPDAIPDGCLSSESDEEESNGKDSVFLKLRTAAQQARLNETRALMLQMTGDLAEASLAPPENVVFVCKLNPLTVAEELRMCFSQFGKVVSCDIVKDRKTGASLRYGFIEFETTEQAERAFLKADKMLVDDSRIHVDFCQSVAGAWQRHRSEIGRKRFRD